MEQRVLVTGVSMFNFEDKDGQRVSGMKVTYFTQDPSVKKNTIGFLPVQVNVPLDLSEKFNTLPGIYNAKYSMVSGRNNKPELAITDFEFLESYTFEF